MGDCEGSDGVRKEVAAAYGGPGFTEHEAARAVGIGMRTGERLMTKPDIRQVVDETRAAGSGMGDGDPAIWALLRATDEEGNPDLVQRLKGVELALADLDGESGGRGLLPGVTVLLTPALGGSTRGTERRATPLQAR